MSITVRLFAGAADAAGVDEATCGASSIDELASELDAMFGPEFMAVYAQCAVVVAGVRSVAGDPIPADTVVDVLPPFAGG